MMNPRRALEVRAWPDLAIEAALRLGGSFQPLARSSWPLPSGLKERVTVRWPRVYQWYHAHRWGEQLLDMLRRRVTVRVANMPQPYKGTIQSEFQVDGRT